MQVVMAMGGCSLGYADEIRRACAKKKAKLMDKLGKEFKYGKLDANGKHVLKPNGEPVILGAVNNGFTEAEADNMWDMIRKFAGYAFNKSHAAAYAVNAYQTAYLKYYYPAEFMAEVLSAKSEQDEIATSIKECKRLGVPILPPDVNKSDEGFAVEVLADGRTGIRFGIQAIKGISSAVEIKAHRPYVSVDDFFSKVSGTAINKGKAEALILAGAFDSLNSNRHEVYNHYFGNLRGDSPVDQDTFNKLKETKKHNTSYVLKDRRNYNDKHKFAYEQELMGIYVSGHPLDEYPCKPWSLVSMNETVEYIGILKKVNVRQDRYNRAYAFFKIETREDIVDSVIWSNDYGKYGDRVIEGDTVIVRGKKTNSRDSDQLVVNQVLVNPKVMNKQKNAQNNNAIALNMTPMANPTDDLYNHDSVNNILYGQNNPVPVDEPAFQEEIATTTFEQPAEMQPSGGGMSFDDLFGGYC